MKKQIAWKLNTSMFTTMATVALALLILHPSAARAAGDCAGAVELAPGMARAYIFRGDAYKLVHLEKMINPLFMGIFEPRLRTIHTSIAAFLSAAMKWNCEKRSVIIEIFKNIPLDFRFVTFSR